MKWFDWFNWFHKFDWVPWSESFRSFGWFDRLWVRFLTNPGVVMAVQPKPVFVNDFDVGSTVVRQYVVREYKTAANVGVESVREWFDNASLIVSKLRSNDYVRYWQTNGSELVRD